MGSIPSALTILHHNAPFLRFLWFFWFTVFKDPLSITVQDPDFPERFVDLGLSDRQRLLVVVYCERGAKLRIISAREAEKYERKDYENG